MHGALPPRLHMSRSTQRPVLFVTFIIYLMLFMFNETIISGKLITMCFFVL